MALEVRAREGGGGRPQSGRVARDSGARPRQREARVRRIERRPSVLPETCSCGRAWDNAWSAVCGRVGAGTHPASVSRVAARGGAGGSRRTGVCVCERSGRSSMAARAADQDPRWRRAWRCGVPRREKALSLALFSLFGRGDGRALSLTATVVPHLPARARSVCLSIFVCACCVWAGRAASVLQGPLHAVPRPRRAPRGRWRRAARPIARAPASRARTRERDDARARARKRAREPRRALRFARPLPARTSLRTASPTLWCAAAVQSWYAHTPRAPAAPSPLAVPSCSTTARGERHLECRCRDSHDIP